MIQSQAARRWTIAALAVIAVVAAIAGIVWLLGPGTVFVAGDVVRDLRGKEKADALNSVRQTLLSAVAGLAALVAVVMAVRTFVLSRRGQHADRYAKAVGLLSSEKLAERIGGIYALEHVIRDSFEDRLAVVEVLAAFVRGSVQEDGADRPAADVQAALTVLSRLPGSVKVVRVDLTGADLRGARLDKARLPEVVLDYARLDRATLSGADLAGASLRNSVLADGNLDDCNLSNADLTHADLRGARLRHALLRRALLVRARLDATEAYGVDLTAADLHDACVVNADLRRANLTGTILVDIDGWESTRHDA